MVETVKRLSGEQDEEIVNQYLDKAFLVIKRYINNPRVDIEGTYQSCLIDLAVYYIKNRNHTGLKSISQGSISLSFDKDSEIPSDIKASLPRYCGMF